MVWRRGSSSFACLVLGLFFLCLPGITFADTEGPSRVLEGGNNIYRIFIEDNNGSGRLGTYTAGTGPDHVPDGENILFGAFDPPASPGSSYLTVRSYTSETDYVSCKEIPESTFTVLNLNNYGTVDIIPGGFRTTWVLPGPPTTPDAMTIVQTTVVEGAGINDSRIRVTTEITNDGDLSENGTLEIGIRYEWDLKIGENDDSWFKKIDPDGAWQQEFEKFEPPAFGGFATTNDPNNPFFTIYGTVNNDYGLVPSPSDPEIFMYAHWLVAFNKAWDFDVVGTMEDSAVLYFWGSNSTIPLVLEAGGSVSRTAYLGTRRFEEEPPPQENVPALSEWGIYTLIALLGILIILKRRIAI